MRYSDQPRVIADATMWAFGKPGRPEAILKAEAYRGRNREKSLRFRHNVFIIIG